MSKNELLQKVAQSYIELRNWDEALKICKTLKANGLEHEQYEAQALLGRIKTEFGTSSGAISGLKKLLKKFPSNEKIFSHYLEVATKHQGPKERLALWNSFLISCPEESSARLEEFEKDFDNQLRKGEFKIVDKSNEILKQRIPFVQNYVEDILKKTPEQTIHKGPQRKMTFHLYP